MKTRAAIPFLLPPDTAVDPEPWRLADGEAIGERLDHWDSNTDIELSRVMTVDIDEIRSACRLGEESSFTVFAAWRSDLTRLAGTSEVVQLGTLGGRVKVPVVVNVPGARAGGRLRITSSICLRTAGEEASSISPRRPGSLLWVDEIAVDLEGGAARFPVAAVEFSSTRGLQPGGGWHLEWGRDSLDQPVLAAMRLLIDVEDPELVAAVRTGSADIRSRAVREFIRYDVARSLVQGALSNDDFVDSFDQYDEGTMGRMLHELIASAWPGIPIATLRGRLRDDPSRIESELRSHLGGHA